MHTATIANDQRRIARFLDWSLPLNSIISAISLVWVLVAVGGCHDSLAPASQGIRPPPRIANVMQALPPVTVSLPDTPMTRVFMGSYLFKEGVLVEGSIQRTIHVSSDAGASCVHVNDSVDYKGIYIYCSGGSPCAWAAAIQSIGGTTPSFNSCSSTEPRFTNTAQWRDTILVGGIGGNDSVFAKRGGGSLDAIYCGANLCHQTSGANTVTVTPLAADLDLRGFYKNQAGRTIFGPVFTHAAAIDTIVFADSTTPRSARGIQMPLQPFSWAWRKADPNATPDWYYHSTDINQCPSNPAPFYAGRNCNLFVKESGVLTSVVRVNGLQHTDSVCVQCLVNDTATHLPDTILNSQAVRTAMLQLADSTHGHDANLNNRTEQVAAVLRNRLNGQFTVYIFIQTQSDRCFSQWNPLNPAALGDDSVVAYIHTHPVDSGEVYTCPDTLYRATLRPGPSRFDSIARWRVNDSTPAYHGHDNPTWYIMSMDGVYKMDATNSDSSHNSEAAWFHGLCMWIRNDSRNDRIIRGAP